MRYRVLWIDDDYRLQEAFISFAEQHGIDIKPFEFVEDGLKELESDLTKYHAVILDAKVKLKEGNQTANLDGLTTARDRMVEINSRCYLPYFIYTGNPDYQKAEWFRSMVQEYYIKERDRQVLIDLIKERVNNKEEYVIEMEFDRIFEMCSEKYLGESKRARFIKLAQFIKGPHKYDEDIFNIIRKSVESCFRLLNRYGFLPDRCIPENNVNFTWTIIFLSGRHLVLPDGNSFSTSRKIPDVLIGFLYQIKEITSSGSHDEDVNDARSKIEALRNLSECLYLAKALAFQAFEFASYCRGLVDVRPNPEENMKEWTIDRGKYPSGSIELDGDGNYHCDEYLLLRSWIEHNGYQIGDKIEIAEEEPNTNPRNKGSYPKFAKKFRKLEF